MDPLARALVPTLLHELANTTQLLTGLHALLGLPDAGELLERREGDLARAGDEAHRLGWLLGVLGAASGHDLLHARRERAGLQWMHDLVQKAARKLERPLGPGPDSLPRLVGAAQTDGWMVPWAFGQALWSLPPGASWDLTETAEGIELRGSRLDARTTARLADAGCPAHASATGSLLLAKGLLEKS